MPISEVYNMDCMEYMKGIPDKFFDLAIVDPQYGIDIMHKGGMPKHLGFKQYKRKDWDKKPPGKRYFQELFRVSKNQIIFGGNYFTQHLPPKMGWIVWDKGQHGLTMSDGELALGEFDLDPCAPMHPLWPTAKIMYNKQDNGLIQNWGGEFGLTLRTPNRLYGSL